MFDKLETTVLAVEGMTCGHCQKRVEDALKAVKGVKRAEVRLQPGEAEVAYQPTKTGRDQLVRAVEAAGYTVRG